MNCLGDLYTLSMAKGSPQAAKLEPKVANRLGNFCANWKMETTPDPPLVP